MVFTGLKVAKGTSTNRVIHLAIAPFHNPGNSWDFTVKAPFVFCMICHYVFAAYVINLLPAGGRMLFPERAFYSERGKYASAMPAFVSAALLYYYGD